MLDHWLAALEATVLAAALRDSTWVYPLVNAGHVLGVALLVGSIIPLYLRLLSLWRSMPLAPLWHVLTRTAAVGLVLAAFFGSLLFATRATEYAASPFFIAKLAVVLVATANAITFRRVLADVTSVAEPSNGHSWRVRAAAAISMTAWLAALTLGRLIGYF